MVAPRAPRPRAGRMRAFSSASHAPAAEAVQGGRVRPRPTLLAAVAAGLLLAAVGLWLLLRPVDPAGGAVPAPITVPESTRTAPVPAPTTTPPAPSGPTDVVPPPPVDDDDDDDGPDDDDDD